MMPLRRNIGLDANLWSGENVESLPKEPHILVLPCVCIPLGNAKFINSFFAVEIQCADHIISRSRIDQHIVDGCFYRLINRIIELIISDISQID